MCVGSCLWLLQWHRIRGCDCHVVQLIPGTADYRYNVWGYSTVNFFSPMARYSQVHAVLDPMLRAPMHGSLRRAPITYMLPSFRADRIRTDAHRQTRRQLFRQQAGAPVQG